MTESNTASLTAASGRWRVLKFGGSSVADAGRIRTVARLVAEARGRADRIAVVVSALGGVTDDLIGLAGADGDHRERALRGLEDRHREVAEALGLDGTSAVEGVLAELRGCVEALEEGAPDAATRDLLASFGERLSSRLVAGAVARRGVAAEACDLRALVRTNDAFGAARVRETETLRALREHFVDEPRLLVATGYLGSTQDGRTTTLGRGGSDLTAALLGAALDAEEVEIWTDVDGVLSADPRLVEDAFSIPRLSYEEIMELAHFGAKVLYPPTVTPARRRNVPLRIRNTFHPDFAGTLVINRDDSAPLRPVTGITAIEDVALLRLEGSGLLGATGTARRFFGALARADSNVILISQASSEHSICCAVAPDSAERARREVNQEFAEERRARRVRSLVVEPGMSVVAVVGEGMRERPGVAGAIFSVLGANDINVRAIAQGSSELNISLVVHGDDRARAVRVLHGELFQDTEPTTAEPTLEVVVAGVGGVGSALLEMLLADRERLRLVGLLDSRHQRLGELDLDNVPADSDAWRDHLANEGSRHDPSTLLAFLRDRGERVAFVDCTASVDVAGRYEEMLRLGVGVVAANKIAFADNDDLPWTRRGAIHEPGPPEGVGGVGFEATVGAGLPVISTLRTLLDGGDRILEIGGVFSGTLGYLLASLRAGARVSDAVRAAYDAGYTEPDPRDDLSGMDVARKLLILARVCGARLGLADLDVAPLVPLDPSHGLDEFWRALPAFDEAMTERFEEAHALGQSYAYLASIRFTEEAEPELHGTPSVGLARLPLDHPAIQLQGADNLFYFTTDRYRERPLVIRGPGAGTRVTAAGVLADLLALHRRRCPLRLRGTRPDGGEARS